MALLHSAGQKREWSEWEDHSAKRMKFSKGSWPGRVRLADRLAAWVLYLELMGIHRIPVDGWRFFGFFGTHSSFLGDCFGTCNAGLEVLDLPKDPRVEKMKKVEKEQKEKEEKEERKVEEPLFWWKSAGWKVEWMKMGGIDHHFPKQVS